MLGASAMGWRIRYDATLDVQVQVQLHRVPITDGNHLRGVPRECPIRFARAGPVGKGQKGMHSGSGLRGHTLHVVARRGMAEEQLQQPQR
jgi:hypothetical protein